MWRLMLAILCLFPVSAMAQNEAVVNRSKPDVLFNVGIDVGYSRTNPEYPITLPAGWQRNFIPPGGDMSYKRAGDIFLRIGGELEPSLPIGKARIGIPIGYSTGILNPTTQGFSTTTLHWWDRVTVQDMRLKRTTPRMGLNFEMGRLMAHMSVQKFRMQVREYTGKDCGGCVNTSKPNGQKSDVATGWSDRWGMYFRVADYTSIGVFVDDINTNFRQFGVQFRGSGGIFHRPKDDNKP